MGPVCVGSYSVRIWLLHNHLAQVLLICLLSYVECVLFIVEHSIFVVA